MRARRRRDPSCRCLDVISMSLNITPSVGADSYRPDIDGLRAFAVLSVVAFHIGLPGLPGGFIGVDIFFVISGYLISGLLKKELVERGRIDFKAFYARRIRRLAPALVLVVLATLLAAYFVMLPDDQNKLGREVRGVALLSANHHFLQHAFDYFDSDSDLKPMLHIWSLAVEEQYYLVWPLLMWLVFRRWGSGSSGRERPVRGLLSLVWLLSFGLCLWLSLHDTPRAFYLMPARAWEFASGALLAMAPQRAMGRGRAASLAGAGLLLLAGSVLFLNDKMLFPGWIALLPVLGTVLLIWGGAANRDNPVSRLMSWRPWVVVGILSYGFYLWHWPLLVLGRYWGLGERALERDFLLGGVLALGLAWLSYRYVEQPLRQRRLPCLGAVKPTLKTGLWLTLSMWLLGTVSMYAPKHFPWLGQQAILQAKHDAMSFNDACNMPGDGLPLPPRAACMIGQPNAPLRLLAWGDSHTDHLMPMYEQLAKQHGVSILRRVYHGCPPLPDVTPVGEGKMRTWCTRFARAVREELPDLKAKGVTGVLMNARWIGYAAEVLPGRPAQTGVVEAGLQGVPKLPGNMIAGVPPLDHASSMRVLEAALGRQAAYLQSLGLKLVLVSPEPEMRYSPAECVARKGAQACNVPRQNVESERAEVAAMLGRLTAAHANVRLWDPINRFCDADTCYASKNGLIRYQDRDHIGATMARSLGADFDVDFRWALAP
ncbi:hypothetical protein DK842_15960 [Chromobacterium phragmitis]|nr:hypothetical protein DK842_15960 [Chromobacterium phragmitis]